MSERREPRGGRPKGQEGDLWEEEVCSREQAFCRWCLELRLARSSTPGGPLAFPSPTLFGHSVVCLDDVPFIVAEGPSDKNIHTVF